MPESPERLSSGSATLDAALGGGLPRGFVALVSGPSGAGKSLLAAMVARACAASWAWALAAGWPRAAWAAHSGLPESRLLTVEPRGAALVAGLRAACGVAPGLLVVDGLEAAASDAVAHDEGALNLGAALAELAWSRQLVLLVTTVEPRAELAAVAPTWLALSAAPARLTVVKAAGAPRAELAWQLRGGQPEVADPDAAPAGLAAEVLEAFRTAQTLTITDLAALTGASHEALVEALAALESNGWLAATRATNQPVVYRRRVPPPDGA